MARAKSDKRRQALIEAAIKVVARDGHPGATVDAVAREAGLANGIVSFYFRGKADLFSAAFKDLIVKYDAIVARHLQAAGDQPLRRLEAMIAAAFDPEALDRARIAAWFAFWAAEMSRKPRRDAASRAEFKYTRAAIVECRRLSKLNNCIDATAAGTGLVALLDGFWWAMMTAPKSVKPEQAAAACRAYLAALHAG
jgi:TetR/AcrR family transcriptional repressor of bet genes